jgi:hypothetical protein
VAEQAASTLQGFYALWNWFDERTWYPLGRVIGGTLYPGLIFTAGSIYRTLHFLNIPIAVQEVRTGARVCECGQAVCVSRLAAAVTADEVAVVEEDTPFWSPLAPA